MRPPSWSVIFGGGSLASPARGGPTDGAKAPNWGRTGTADSAGRYHVTVAGKHACSEFIHIHNVIFCTVERPLLVELAGIRTHCTPFQSAAEAESKIHSVHLLH